MQILPVIDCWQATFLAFDALPDSCHSSELSMAMHVPVQPQL